MKRFFTYATVVICLGATATLAVSKGDMQLNPDVEARLAGDGAFRDGLYLGKLAAEGGKQPRLAVGRWSTEQDRSQFTAGYRRGYAEALGTNSESDPSAE